MYYYTFSRIVCIKYYTFSRIRYADCYIFSRIKRIILLRHGKTVPIRLSNTGHVDCTFFRYTLCPHENDGVGGTCEHSMSVSLLARCWPTAAGEFLTA